MSLDSNDVDTLKRVARSVHGNATRIAAEIDAARSRPLTRGDLADMLCGEAEPCADVIGIATAINNLGWLRDQPGVGADAPFRAYLPIGTHAPGSIAEWLARLAELLAEARKLDGIAALLGQHIVRRGPRRTAVSIPRPTGRIHTALEGTR